MSPRMRTIGIPALAVTIGAYVAWAQARPAFERIVTEQVVVSATKELARWADAYVPHANMNPTDLAGYQARHEAFIAYRDLGEDYPSKTRLRQQVLDTVRAHLASPERLEEAYRKFKPVVLANVGGTKVRAGLRAALEHILPVMASDGAEFRSAEFRELKRRELAAERCMDECKEVTERLAEQVAVMLEKHGITVDHILAWEWIQRRHAEGGARLVNRWLTLLRDMERSL